MHRGKKIKEYEERSGAEIARRGGRYVEERRKGTWRKK